MPTPTNFEGINPRGTQTLIPCKDAKAQNGVIANTKLIKDTVGWSGKNIFDIEGWLKSNGVTFTKSGNVYTFTPNTNLYNNHYIISDSDIDVILSSVITPTEGSIADNIGFEMFDSQNRQITSRGNSGSGKVSWLRLNWTTYGEITIETPMIRSADILDSTYEPYFGSTAVDWSSYAKTGAVNLMPFPYYNASNSESNVTWVIADDGTVTVSTPNGASTAQVNIHLVRPDNFPTWLLNKPVKLCGCPSGGSNTTYQFGAYQVDGTNSVNDYGDGTDTFTFTSAGQKQVSITIRPNVTLSTPLVFKPMLTLADYPLCDYEHFVSPAMTNRELTEKVTVKDVTSALSALVGSLAQYNNFVYKQGNILFCSIRLSGVTANAYTNIAKVTGYAIKDDKSFFAVGKIVGGSLVGFSLGNVSGGFALQCTENLSNQEVIVYGFSVVLR